MATSASTQTRFFFFPLLGLTALAFALRYYNWDLNSYWSDELWSASCSNPAYSFRQLLHNMENETNPYLYQVLLWLCYKLFGYNAFVGRFFSILTGTAVIPAMYLLGNKVGGSKLGLCVALLATPNYLAIQTSLDTRSYSLFLFLSVISFYFLLLSTENRTYSLAISIAYALSAILLLNIHFYGYLALLAHGLYVIVLAWKERRLPFKHAAIYTAVFIINFPFLLRMFTLASNTGQFWIPIPDLAYFIDCFVLLFNDKYIAFFMTALVCCGLWVNRREPHTLFLILAFLCVFLLPFVISQFTPYGVLFYRYITPLLPPLFLVAGTGLISVPGRLVRPALLALFIFLSARTLVMNQVYTKPYKEDYRGAILSVTEKRGNLQVFGIHFFNVLCEWHKLGFSVDEPKDIPSQVKPGEKFWIVNPTALQKPPSEALGAKLLEEHSYDRVWAALYEKQ